MDMHFLCFSLSHTHLREPSILSTARCHSGQSLLAELRILPVYTGSAVPEIRRKLLRVFCRFGWEFLFSFYLGQAGWGPVTVRRAARSKCCCWQGQGGAATGRSRGPPRVGVKGLLFSKAVCTGPAPGQVRTSLVEARELC